MFEESIAKNITDESGGQPSLHRRLHLGQVLTSSVPIPYLQRQPRIPHRILDTSCRARYLDQRHSLALYFRLQTYPSELGHQALPRTGDKVQHQGPRCDHYSRLLQRYYGFRTTVHARAYGVEPACWHQEEIRLGRCIRHRSLVRLPCHPDFRSQSTDLFDA